LFLPEVVRDAPRREETALGMWEADQARFERLVSHCPPDLWEGSEVVPAPLPPLPWRLVAWRALYVLARPTPHVREAWRVSGWLVLSRITD
jgi:hypothetical protein